MRSFLRTLEKLDTQDSLFVPQEKLVFLLSGQSDYAHSELSEEQKRFLNLFEKHGFAPLETGFPFNKLHNFKNRERSGIIRASLRNAEQFIALVLNEHFRKLVAKHLQPAFDASASIIIVCQSSGLQMLKSASPLLKIKPDAKIKVFALGPVMWNRFADKRFEVHIIKGKNDWVSNSLDKTPTSFKVNCNHMDYCHSPEVHQVIENIFTNEN